MPKVRASTAQTRSRLGAGLRRLGGSPAARRARTALAPAARRTAAGARRTGRVLRSRPSRVLYVVLAGLAAGYIGLLLGGRVVTPVGPTNVQLSLQPSLHGGTALELPPIGALRLDTHWGPLALEAKLTEVRPDEAQRLIEDDVELTRLTDRIADQLRDGVKDLLVRAAVLALAASFAATLVLFRSWRRALLGMGSAATGIAAVLVLTWTTFNPRAISEPRYTGLLANAPQVVGDAQNLVDRFSAYREQLAKLVGNVSELYATTSTLPVYEPDPSTIRVLHVSDIHLNPAAWSVIDSVATQFQVKFIIDSGDLMDHGSEAENEFANSIGDLDVPYVYIRGNHDSEATAEAVAEQDNAIVLDDETREIEGLRVYGVGDPRFTPDKSTRDDNVGAEQLYAQGTVLAEQLRETRANPDIAVVHDPTEGKAFSGLTPLVLSGHTHTRKTELLPTGTRLFVQGSTGAAGLRGLEQEEPTPFELSVLYFNRSSKRLQGWDDLRLGGLGLTSANIERQLEPEPDRAIRPRPPAIAPPSSPTSPFPSEWPSDWPSRTPSPPPSPSPFGASPRTSASEGG
ncbi:metallophosphoesterase [Spirillospora sp. NPDC052242]